MQSDTATAYLRTQVLTASPEQLRLMLIDGALKFTRQGREAIIAKDFEGIYNGFNRARNIVLELMNSVRADLDPSLKANLNALYTFIYIQLVEGCFERDLAKTDKAIERLEYERETWVLAIQEAVKARGGKPDAATVPNPIATITPQNNFQAAPQGSRPSLSIQG